MSKIHHLSNEQVLEICELLQRGVSIDDVSARFDVAPHFVVGIERGLTFHGGMKVVLDRLHELNQAKLPTLNQTINQVESNTKGIATLLIRGGMQPGQVHIATGLSIHKCRHLFKLVRERMEVAESLLPLPETLSGRLVMSIFANHYLYLCERTGSISVLIDNVITAWSQTKNEVAGNGIDLLPDFDPKVLSLGTLFEVARGLREAMPNADHSFKESKRVRKITHNLCHVCKCRFVAFSTGRRIKAAHCCYCELSKLIDKENKLINGGERKRRKASEKVDDSNVNESDNTNVQSSEIKEKEEVNGGSVDEKSQSEAPQS